VGREFFVFALVVADDIHICDNFVDRLGRVHVQSAVDNQVDQSVGAEATAAWHQNGFTGGFTPRLQHLVCICNCVVHTLSRQKCWRLGACQEKDGERKRR